MLRGVQHAPGRRALLRGEGGAAPQLLLLTLAAVVVAAFCCTSGTTTEPEPPQQERAALQAFLADTPHKRALGWNSPSACLWFGVTCDGANATVITVRLPTVGLIDGLPLRTLRTLSLRSNRLFGGIPGNLFALSLLRSLYLQGNRLSGAIPPEVGRLFALQHLVLSHNNLSGAVPLAPDGLTDLRSLRLDGNRLSGNLPSLSLGRLEVFNVSYNQLNGPILSSLARFLREDFTGNLQLCGEPLDRPCEPPAPSPVEKRKKLSGAAECDSVSTVFLRLRKIYVAGGHDKLKNTLKTAEAYDAEADTWDPLSDMSEERDECDGMATVAGDRFLAVSGYRTGRQGGFERDAEWFDPATREWRRLERA